MGKGSKGNNARAILLLGIPLGLGLNLLLALVAIAHGNIQLDAANVMNCFAYNTGFGIEGTVLASIVVSISCVVIFFLGRKKKLHFKFSNSIRFL